MRIKDNTVETEFHPMLTQLLFAMDQRYRKWDSELVITSGSEPTTKHGLTSLHYAKPACAADTRIWEVVTLDDEVVHASGQYKAMLEVRDKFCLVHFIPTTHFDIIQEGDHIHTEYQPKRPAIF